MIELHGFFNSSASYRVRIALALKGIDYQHVGVNIRSGIQNGHAYRLLNPTGLVPTLAVGHRYIAESLAIIDYLDRLQPEPPLLPSDSEQRTRVLEIANLVACDIHPLNNLRVTRFLSGAMGLDTSQLKQWSMHWFTLGFEALETLLPKEGNWCVGDAPTLADCCLAPQVANALRAGFDLSPYARVRHINERCMRHPAFTVSMPSAQPDYLSPGGEGLTN